MTRKRHLLHAMLEDQKIEIFIVTNSLVDYEEIEVRVRYADDLFFRY